MKNIFPKIRIKIFTSNNKMKTTKQLFDHAYQPYETVHFFIKKCCKLGIQESTAINSCQKGQSIVSKPGETTERSCTDLLF